MYGELVNEPGNEQASGKTSDMAKGLAVSRSLSVS